MYCVYYVYCVTVMYRVLCATEKYRCKLALLSTAVRSTVCAVRQYDKAHLLSDD